VFCSRPPELVTLKTNNGNRTDSDSGFRILSPGSINRTRG